MVSPRLTCRIATSPQMAAVYAVFFFALASCSSSVAPATVRAEDSKDAGAVAEETDPDFVVPDGTPEEILEFVKKLNGQKPKFANQQERINYIIKLQRALISAGDKILNQKTEDKVAATGAQMKLGALTMLASGQIGDSAKEALAAAIKLKGDERPAVAKVVDQFWNPIRIFNVANMAPAERKEFASELTTAVSDTKFSGPAVQAASQLGDILSNGGHIEEAGDLYDRLATLAIEADDPKFHPNAERFKAIGRRMRLPGNFMDLEGKLLAGGDFDWASYRGKVVLVDFWATWCGPCIAELPNVKENYKKYHDKGFEVVGISLDKSQAPLDSFIEKEEIPWAQLYDEVIQKGKGWNHPMAQHYGINGIPAAILVDKDGKVVSMRARGEELPTLLEKLLGKAD